MLAHAFEFDPTYGYDEAALSRIEAPPGPADFAAFWQATFAEAMAVPLQLSVTAIASPCADHELFHVEYDSAADVRIGGWITRPRRAGVRRGVVVGHGYGGRQGPEFDVPGCRDAATIQFCARGFHRSARADIPGTAERHVTHGIGHRDTYVHRGCVADLWLAASALLAWMPELDLLDYFGQSFGGGIGALALPWDRRFRRAVLSIPSFGHHRLRVTLPCVGSGHWVSRVWRRDPSVLDVLAYFDAATAARHITIPTLVTVARFDPAVPPPGQAAVFNGLPPTTPRARLWMDAGHFDHPGRAEDDRRLREAADAWLAERPILNGICPSSGVQA